MTFWLAGSIGQLFSGFLQAAAYTNLDGVEGRAGWRWLFIIDGIITIPLALAGFIFFPNLPQSGKKTWWTSEEEHVLSVKRMEAIGRAGEEPWSMAKARRILTSWHTYLLRMASNLPYNSPTANTEYNSTVIHCLEQWISSGRYGILAEEFQCDTRSCSRKTLYSGTN